MTPWRGRLVAVWYLALLLAVLMPVLSAINRATSADTPKAKLAVLVVFDQFRGDYLTRWDKQLTAGGFHRLESDGVWFQDCRYPYANTVTSAGHASLVTGCSPDQHGIILNDWYDRDAGASVYCVTSPRYQQVPPAKKGADAEDKKGGSGTPERLLAPTLGDALKAATDGK